MTSKKINIETIEQKMQAFKTDVQQFDGNVDELKQYIQSFAFTFDDCATSTSKKSKSKKEKEKDETKLCCALCQNKKRCTYNKKPGSNFCGNHEKLQPYGTYSEYFGQVLVHVQEKNGIPTFQDKAGNVYITEDIVNNEPFPRVLLPEPNNADDVKTI